MREPILSVIVPVHRNWAALEGFLEAWDRQDPRARAEVELIVVDNDPEPAARPSRLPREVLFVRSTAAGSYGARNDGAARARGARLVFTDADCLPAPHWLSSYLEVAAEPGLVAGPVRMIAGPAPNPCEIFELVRGIPQESYVARGYAATANLSVPRALFRRLGGFDAARRSGGDAEFCRRAARLEGVSIRQLPEAVTCHPARSDWDALARKARRVKGGQVSAGTVRRRLGWTLYTLLPPVREILRYCAAPQRPRSRLLAVGMRLRLWGIEMAETLRLWCGGTPERR